MSLLQKIKDAWQDLLIRGEELQWQASDARRELAIERLRKLRAYMNQPYGGPLTNPYKYLGRPQRGRFFIFSTAPQLLLQPALPFFTHALLLGLNACCKASCARPTLLSTHRYLVLPSKLSSLNTCLSHVPSFRPWVVLCTVFCTQPTAV